MCGWWIVCWVTLSNARATAQVVCLLLLPVPSFDADMNTHMSQFPIMDDSAIVILHSTVGHLGRWYIVGWLSHSQVPQPTLCQVSWRIWLSEYELCMWESQLFSVLWLSIHCIFVTPDWFVLSPDRDDLWLKQEQQQKDCSPARQPV